VYEVSHILLPAGVVQEQLAQLLLPKFSHLYIFIANIIREAIFSDNSM
jgi:hypothetical protein